ncbi:MAG: hypothetical protein KDD51_01280 [Bdellovibrionales bacterium]|nr:hypothetical protein [Bdellovibrionales bacterium]
MIKKFYFASWRFLFLSPLFLGAACSRPAGNPATALVRAANGTNYSVSCLQQMGPDKMDQCEVDPNAASSQGGGSRGLVVGNDQPVAHGDSHYVVFNILSFQQKAICNYLFGAWNVEECYTLFGYQYPNNHQPPSGGWCDPYQFNPIYYFMFPNRCYYQPTPQGAKLLEIRKEPNLQDGGLASWSVIIYSSGELYSNFCPGYVYAAVQNSIPAQRPCQQTYLQRLNAETIRLINVHLDQAKDTPLTEYNPEIQCLAASQYRFVYEGRSGSVPLRIWDSPCGSDQVNESTSGGILIRFLDRVWDYFAPN